MVSSHAANLKVAIVGGGIGGLTAALALRRIGAEVRVFERAPEIKEVGAGLGLWANAIRVLDELHVGAAVRAAALPMQTTTLYSDRGRLLHSVDMTAFTQELGVPSFVMHRANLQAALLAALPPDVVVTGAECVGVDDDAAGGRVRFANRASYAADVVIGADGFNSVVRRFLWGETPVRYSGQTCYRGVVRGPVAHPGLLAEIQGRGRRLGYCPFAKDRMYWFACHNAARNEPEDPRGAQAKLREMFQGWPFDMAEIIAATPPEAILRNDLCDRAPLKKWGRGSVTLLGDAGHPMLPNLGQGACSAIEDAAVLAHCLATEPDRQTGLARYEAERIPRTTRLTEMSWRFGILAAWTNPIAVGFRELMLRCMPDSMMHRELNWQLGYRADVGS